MDKNVEIQSLMTLCPHSVGFDQDLQTAREMMRNHGFHHLPVLKGGRIVGVVSDRDLKYAGGWSKASETGLRVEDVYMPEPITVDPTTKLEDVLRTMVKEQIGCVLVSVNKDKLVGIFTVTDACRYLADLLAAS